MPLWFGLLAVVTVACLFTWYISPDRNSSPSRIRKFVAISWVVFRRIVSFFGAIFGLFISYSMWTSSEEITDTKIYTTLILIILSAGFVFIGIVGISRYESSIVLYKKIKKKYGMR